MIDSRVDKTRLGDARETVTFMVGLVEPDGFLRPPESLFGETTGYQAEAAATLALAGSRLGMPEAIKAAKRMFDRLLTRRLNGELWSLDWKGGFPTRDPLPENWREQNTIPDPRYTAATLLSLAIYSKAADDDSVVETARKSMAAMFREWDFMGQDYLHLTREYAALAVAAWGETMAEFVPATAPILSWVRETFVALAPNDFPFSTAMRTMLLLATLGPDCVSDVIAPGVERLLAEPRWRFPDSPNDFRHIDSTDDHVNTRGNTAVALTFRLIDLAHDRQDYTNRPLYEYLSAWIDAMRNPAAGYFECQDVKTGRRWGQGSPAHFLPLWWILGGFQV